MPNALPIIVTDLDGVLVDIMTEILEQIWDALGVALTPEDCTEYDVAKAFGSKLQHKLDERTLQDCLKIHVWDNPGVYRSARPYWPVHQTYQSWLRAGGNIAVLTSRPDMPSVVDATRAWLHAWGYDGVDFHLSRTYGGKEAALEQILEDLELRRAGSAPPSEIWVVEDDPAQAAGMAQVLADNPEVQGHVYMLERPWTKSCYGGLLKKRYLEQDVAERIEAARS